MTRNKKNKNNEFVTLESSLEYSFEDPSILLNALRHPSSANKLYGNNQRLEFLGDRVLGLFVAELLYKNFPNEPEGALAKRFSALVNRDSLAIIAEDIDIGSYIELGQSEKDIEARKNPGHLADALEAIIAALFLDGGAQVARNFVRKYWEPLASSNVEPPSDFKTRLQEWSQSRNGSLPNYTIVSRSGPPHQPIFSVEVRVKDFDPEYAEGSSKQSAEQAAAKKMIEKLEIIKS
tara:strand:- start:10480 stop:11184 length:705 start_codon:yes stop_codon:yes gene_type:complete